MGTRLLAAGLWFLVALYAGSMLLGIVGLHELVGPAIGLMSAALIMADPFHRLAADRPAVPIELEAVSPDRLSEVA